jgi:prostaglandin-H2 D-isomerase / glutathione transferase
MPTLTLTYFDIKGGRGEPARLALKMAGIDFEDQRVTMQQWATIRPNMPFQALPVLHIDGEAISQSNAINRYVGKLCGLYPQDALQALRCDEIMDVVEDITAKFATTFNMPDVEKKAAREKIVTGPLQMYLHALENKLKRQGGEFFCANALSMADLKVLVLCRYLSSGILDYVPQDIIRNSAPLLHAHYQRMLTIPAIAAHYA